MQQENCKNQPNEETIPNTKYVSDDLIRAIEGTKKKDEKAFESLYNKTYKYVYSRAKMFFNDEQEAMEVVQEVYISVYRNIHNLKSNESLFGWLRTITFNAGSHIMNKKKNNVPIPLEEQELDSFVDDNEKLEENYLNKEDVEIIRDCINRLSDEQKTVVLAYYYDNLRVEEIAELLQISVGTVKSRLFSARKKLKESIEQEEKKHGYKLHSFSPALMLPAIKSLLQQNMNTATVNTSLFHNAICRKLNIFLAKSTATNLISKNHGVLKTIFSKTTEKIVSFGMKKAIITFISATTTIGVITGAVSISKNFNQKNGIHQPKNEITSSIAETSSDEANSEVISSQTSTPSKTENTSKPTTSTSNNTTTTIEVNSDCVSNTTPYKTVTLNKKTTYYGYEGYFTLNGYVDEVDLPFYNLGTESSPKALYSTEYYCIEFDKPIYFACDKSKVKQQDFIKYVNQAGQGKTRVNISTSDCISNTTPYKTITLNKKTTYYGYSGYFTNYWHAPITLVELGISDSNKWVATCTTEYRDIESGDNVLFIFDCKKYGANLFMMNIDDNGGRAQIPAKITNIRMDAFERFEEHHEEPLNKYFYFIEQNGDESTLMRCVGIYTVDESEESKKIETEIYSMFENNYGHSTNASVEKYPRGTFSIDDSGRPYSIYLYCLKEPIMNN